MKDAIEVREMNSDDQSSFKLNPILSKDYVFSIGSIILIAIAFLNKDNSQFNSGAFLRLGGAGLGLFSSLLHIRLRAFELGAILTIAILFGTAFLAKGNYPQLSSISFISALSLLFGMMAIISLARFQVFFYGKGQQGATFYIDGAYPTCGESPTDCSSWSAYDGWGGSDCGGDGGGSGDCGS